MKLRVKSVRLGAEGQTSGHTELKARRIKMLTLSAANFKDLYKQAAMTQKMYTRHAKEENNDFI